MYPFVNVSIGVIIVVCVLIAITGVIVGLFLRQKFFQSIIRNITKRI